MKIAMIGTGYVGLTTGTCLASLGNNVVCLDIDKIKIDMLNQGKIPIFEPGLKELLERNVKEGRLSFTTSYKTAVESSEIIFLAVGTPEGNDGQANLSYILSAAEEVGKNMNEYKVIVVKSTVPVGTSEKIKDKIQLHARHDFDVVSNPEFLREGAAIRDFTSPDRVVIGAESDKAKEIMKRLYKGMERPQNPIMITDIKSAELIKCASNAMLAARISFMNQLAPLCEKIGANVKEVAVGMGLDKRIGSRFLQAGIGYGGSCFPKDVKALAYTLRQNKCNADLLDAVDEINENQKSYIIPKIQKILGGDVKGKRIALWGLSFKPRTDDMREAPSLTIIKHLLDLGADVVAFDPVAKENTSVYFPSIEYGMTSLDTIKDADCLVIVTEWDEFRYLDKNRIKELLKQPNVVDGRNIYDPEEMKALGFNYVSVGRG